MRRARELALSPYGLSRLAKIPEERVFGIPGLIARDKVIVALTTESGTCCLRSSSSTDPKPNPNRSSLCWSSGNLGYRRPVPQSRQSYRVYRFLLVRSSDGSMTVVPEKGRTDAKVGERNIDVPLGSWGKFLGRFFDVGWSLTGRVIISFPNLQRKLGRSVQNRRSIDRSIGHLKRTRASKSEENKNEATLDF